MVCCCSPPRAESLWKLFAFLSRYAHQPLPVLRTMPITELLAFAKSVGNLIREESEASRKGAED